MLKLKRSGIIPMNQLKAGEIAEEIGSNMLVIRDTSGGFTILGDKTDSGKANGYSFLCPLAVRVLAADEVMVIC